MNAPASGSNSGEFAMFKPLEFERFGLPFKANLRFNSVEFDRIKRQTSYLITP